MLGAFRPPTFAPPRQHLIRLRFFRRTQHSHPAGKPGEFWFLTENTENINFKLSDGGSKCGDKSITFTPKMRLEIQLQIVKASELFLEGLDILGKISHRVDGLDNDLDNFCEPDDGPTPLDAWKRGRCCG